MQKDTFRNIKYWFYQFQDISGLRPTKPKVVLKRRVLRLDISRKDWLQSALILFLCPLPEKHFILNKSELHAIKNHQLLLSVSFSAHKRENFSSFHLFETLLGRSRSFLVFLAHPRTHYNLFQKFHLLETTIFKMF